MTCFALVWGVPRISLVTTGVSRVRDDTPLMFCDAQDGATNRRHLSGRRSLVTRFANGAQGYRLPVPVHGPGIRDAGH